MEMVVDLGRRAVGVFSNRRNAEQALHELKNSGFPMEKVSVITQDAKHENDLAGTPVQEKIGDKADEGARVGAISGGTLGGLTGLLVGLGTLAIPGIGPIMLAGATATALATTLAGAGIGAAAGGLMGGLIGLGIPEERARVYNERVNRGEYLVIIDGTDAEIAKAQAILQHGGIEEFGIYDHPNARDVSTNVATTTQTYETNQRAIGVFSHQRDAEAALTELQRAGFSMSQVSLIAKDTSGSPIDRGQRNVGVSHKAEQGTKTGASTGGALGGLGGLLVGLGSLAIPGVGPVIAGGTVATAIATALTGGAIGAAVGGIAGGLTGLGIPEQQARKYSDRFQKGDYLVIVDGKATEIRHAATILQHAGIEEFSIYDASNVNERRPDIDEIKHRETPIVPTHTTTYREEPTVKIIDRRDETTERM